METFKKAPASGDELEKRVKRLERVSVVLGVCNIAQGIFGIGLAKALSKLFGSFDLMINQLDFICEQVDNIIQCI